jgi:hypothetical protein
MDKASNLVEAGFVFYHSSGKTYSLEKERGSGCVLVTTYRLSSV